jgi:hypothetical protein
MLERKQTPSGSEGETLLAAGQRGGVALAPGEGRGGEQTAWQPLGERMFLGLAFP